ELLALSVPGPPSSPPVPDTTLFRSVMVTRIGRHRRQPSAAVAWVVLIAALPYVGLPLFLFFGTRKYARPRILANAEEEEERQARSEEHTSELQSRENLVCRLLLEKK